MAKHGNFSGDYDPNEFGFEWTDEELSPEEKKLLDELTVPIDEPQRRFAESIQADIVAEVQERLEALRVERFDGIEKSQIQNSPELQMTPYILDDVHYVVYKRHKLGPFNRFVSVSAGEIFDEFRNMCEAGVDGTHLQREQDAQAVKVLINAGKIDDGSIYEVMVTPKGRFAVRSLYRLLAESCMRPFTNILPKAARRRMDERPLMFDEVAARAIHFLQIKLRQHGSIDTIKLSTDQKLMYELVSRDLTRANAFGLPVAEYIYENLEPKQSS